MNCSEVYRLLSEGRPPAEVRSLLAPHVDACPRCRQPLEIFAAPLPVPPTLASPRPPVTAVLLQDLRPVKPLPGPLFLFSAIFACIALVCLVWVLLMGIPGYHRLAVTQRLAVFCFSLLLGALLAASLLRLLRPAAPPLHPTVFLIAASLVGYPLLVSLIYPLHPQGNFLGDGLLCLAFGLLTSLLTTSLIWRFIHRGYFRHPILAGACLGGLGGVSGVVALHLVCTDLDLAHILLWHSLVLILSEAAGALGGWLFTRRQHSLP